MDISSEKISELLNNPEIAGMIASLASGLMPSGTSESEPKEADMEEHTKDQSEDTNQSAPLTLPESALTGLMPYGKEFQSKDRRIALLQAIKPYVSDSKKDKVDSLVRAIGVAGLLNNYAGGIPGFIFGKN